MTKRFSGPSEAEFLAGLFRRHGIEVDPERLEDRVNALKSRAKVEDKASQAELESIAIAAKKARRTAELAEFDWRQKPNADTLAAARAAQAARNEAADALRELCLQDEQLISNVQRRYGR
jgi:hypothetical protein